SGQIRYVEATGTNLLNDPSIRGIVANFRDLTERTMMEMQLRARVEQQAAIARLGQQALEALDPQALIERAVDVVAKTLGVGYVSVLQLLPAERRFRPRVALGWDFDRETLLPLPPDSQAAAALQSAEPVVVEDFLNN